MTNKNTKKKVLKSQEHVDQMVDTDIEMWVDYFTKGEVPENGMETMHKLSTRVANLGDITAIARHFDSVSKVELMQNLNMLVKRLSVMEYILTDKLSITDEDMKAYAEKYEKELAEVKAEIDRLQKEQEEQEEEPEEEE